jgi:hypothetical protein
MIISPVTLLLLTVIQVLLWFTLSRIEQRWPRTRSALQSLRQLMVLMSLIYTVPAVLHNWNLTLFLFFIPYGVVSAFWCVTWYRRQVNDVNERVLLRRMVRQMSMSLVFIGATVFAFLEIINQFIPV